MSPEYRDIVRSTLAGWGAEDLFPTWSPEGFEASEPQILSTVKSDILNISFNGNGKFYSIEITHFHDSASLAGAFEKDSGAVEEYISNGRLFYIFSNIDMLSGTWLDEEFMVVVSGDLTSDEMKSILDSIGA